MVTRTQRTNVTFPGFKIHFVSALLFLPFQKQYFLLGQLSRTLSSLNSLAKKKIFLINYFTVNVI